MNTLCNDVMQSVSEFRNCLKSVDFISVLKLATLTGIEPVHPP
jgi:hypothetical protein